MNSYAEIVERQKEFFYTGKTKEIAFRIEMLKKLKTGIKDWEEKIMDAVYQDLRKSEFEVFTTEIALVLEEINYFVKNLKKLSKPKRIKTSLINFPAKNYIYKEPYGVSLIISPWNYPFQLAMAPLVGSIAAGNCTIVKPSELSPKTSSVIEEMIKHLFNEAYIKVICGDVEVAQNILQQRFDRIFFTGGTEVGKKVMEQASKFLTPVVLELGGKSPCIIDKEIDLDISAKRIVWGKFLNAGQTCIAPDYLLIHEDIKMDFIQRMKKYMREFYGENPRESGNYTKIINERHFNRLELYLKDGDVIFGGKVDKDSLYMEPTLLDNVNEESRIMKEEIFGPILPILTYKNLEDVISYVNHNPKPLALYFFSTNKINQKKVIANASYGGGCINDTIVHVADMNLPFGGVGESGIGSYHGKASLDAFTHHKSIVKKTFFMDLKLRYPPYDGKLKMVKKLFK
jgi:aldehyde dehydrogenase (NAD+)